MPIPTNKYTRGMDYSHQGEPFVQDVSKSTISTAGLDISFAGEPFGVVELACLYLLELEYTYLGEPFVWTVSKDTIDLAGMDWSHTGEPYVTNACPFSFFPPVSSYIKVIKVSWQYISKVLGRADSLIKKVLGVQP